MKETQAIIDAWNAARAQNQPAILATVVGAEGSTYRRPGARMLLTPNGWAAGSISGGCLEGDIARKAWWRTEAGAPVLVTYDSRSSDDDLAWGFGLGCNGVVRVLLERLSPGNDPLDPVDFLDRCCRQARARGVLATVVGAAAPVEPAGVTAAGTTPAARARRLPPSRPTSATRRLRAGSRPARVRYGKRAARKRGAVPPRKPTCFSRSLSRRSPL
jgi:xanthine/CO dehydrogenase XdhC/CoxF family maturation factor